MKIIVNHNFQRLSAMLTGLGDKKTIQKAVATSIRRTVPAVQKSAFSEIKARKMLNIKSSELKRKARAYLNIGGSKDVSEQYGKIWITPKAESLGRFIASKRIRGKTVRNFSLNAYGSPYLKNPNLSFAVKRGQGFVVFERLAGAKRLPITKQYGPGLAQLVQDSGIVRRMAEVAETRYEREFSHQFQFYAEKALARAKAAK